MSSRRVRAVYMRGGTSKGVFFDAEDLPGGGAARDALLLRVIGSPDPYGRHIDGLGGATSSTSKVVILSRSTRDDSDVDYLFGQVAIDRPLIDWSGNCGNLTSAVGPYALAKGWVPDAPRDGLATVRIWQRNIGKRILAHVPVAGGEVVEEGDFVLDGVARPSAEIRIEFLEPGGFSGEAGADGALLPTGNVVDILEVAGVGPVEASLVSAGNPTAFVRAEDFGLAAVEDAVRIDGDAGLLARAEAVRAQAAVVMGLARAPAEATRERPHTPKIVFTGSPRDARSSRGALVRATDVDISLRMLSMGKMHHAVTGTGAIATAVACAISGTIPHASRRPDADPMALRIGHAAGVLRAGAEVLPEDGKWRVTRVIMSRTARRLMEGWVVVPEVESPLS